MALPTAAGDRRAWTIVLAVILIATFAIRATHFGNPSMHVDEDFYLLVGDRMLHQGALPYVDIWDRKPIGIFLIYAAIRLLGGEGFVQYQVVATLFAAATAFVITRIAARFTTLFASTVAGLCYILWLGLFGGEGGQTPTFYNLFTAVAALLTMKAALADPVDLALIRRNGAIVMLIVGVAMQIKYNVMFEGIFFALTLLWVAWKADPRPLPRLIDALLWMVLALLPTALACAWFAAIGHAQIFFYSNFVSVAERTPVPAKELLKRLGKIAGPMLPFFLILDPALWTGPWRNGRDPAGAAHRFVLKWFLAALIGFLIFGTYYNHYALPLLLPLACAMAPGFAVRTRRINVGMILAAIMLIGGTIAYKVRAHARLKKSGSAEFIMPIAAIVKAHLQGGCLYVHDGETILYYLTGSCIPTRWAFPNHLNTGVERSAIGTDAAAEVARTFATKPTVVVTTLNRTWDLNLASRAVAARALKADYRLIYVKPMRREYRAIYLRLPGR